MARKESSAEVTGGLTAGIVFGPTNDAQGTDGSLRKNQKNTQETVQTENTSLADGYTWERKETRSIKTNIMIKPSIAKKLDRAVDRKEIRSRNDLINYLLEEYFKQDERL